MARRTCSARCRRFMCPCAASPITTRSTTSSSAAARRAACCCSGWLAPASTSSRLEAGPFWDTERDWVSDEAGSHQLYWEDPRVTGGNDPLALGANNCGKGVGGGSVHWAAFTPRLHPSDFEVYTRDGVGVDWPISYEISGPITSSSNWKCPSPARLTIRGAIRMAMPMARIPWAASATR